MVCDQQSHQLRRGNVRNEKIWSAPDVTSTELNGTAYAYLIDIVRSALKQAERDVSENPNDLKAGELLGSLQRMLGALESKAHGTPPDNYSLATAP